MITDDERLEMRRQLGMAVLAIQSEFRAIHKPEDVVPEIIASLLSFAAYVSKNSADFNESEFNIACQTATREQWPKG